MGAFYEAEALAALARAVVLAEILAEVLAEGLAERVKPAGKVLYYKRRVYKVGKQAVEVGNIDIASAASIGGWTDSANKISPSGSLVIASVRVLAVELLPPYPYKPSSYSAPALALHTVVF